MKKEEKQSDDLTEREVAAPGWDAITKVDFVEFIGATDSGLRAIQDKK